MPTLAKQYNALKYATQTDPKPLRQRGGYEHEDNSDRPNKLEIMRIETVEESLTDDESSCTSAHTTEITTDTTLSYNPMADAPNPNIITPSYQPLRRRKKNTGEIHVNPAKSAKVPNLNGISGHIEIMYEQLMKDIKEAEASIFDFNETHDNDLNARHNSLVTKSKSRIINHKNGKYCQTVTSSSNAPIPSFTKPGGNMMGIT